MLSRAQEKGLLAILALVQFNHVLDFVIIMPMGPLLMKQFSLTPEGFSYIVSAYTLSGGVFGFLGAFWLDRFDRRQALLWLFLGFIMGTMAMAIAPTYEWLLIARMLTGAFGGLLGSTVLAIIGDVFPLERRATATGIVMAAFSGASVLGIPVGLALATWVSWHASFYFIAGVSALVWALSLRYVPTMRGHMQPLPDGTPRRPTRPMQVIGSVLSSPNQLAALLMMCLMMVGQFALIPLMNPYLVSNVGFPEGALTLVYLVGGVLTLYSSPKFGRLADRHGHRRVFQLIVLTLCVPVLLLTNLPAVPVWVGLCVTGLLFVLMAGRMVTGSTLITSTAPPERRASLLSLNTAVQHISTSVAAIIGGLIVIQLPNGQLAHYSWVGALAVVTNLGAFWVARYVTAAPGPPADALAELDRELLTHWPGPTAEGAALTPCGEPRLAPCPELEPT